MMRLEWNIADAQKAWLEEGIEEGRKEGREENSLMNIRNLMKNLGWSLEQAAANMGIPKNNWDKYRKLISDIG